MISLLHVLESDIMPVLEGMTADGITNRTELELEPPIPHNQATYESY